MTKDDLISKQAAIDAILAVTGNSSVRELYEHVQEHGLSDMWSCGVNAAIDIIIAVPSAHPDITDEQAIVHLQASGWMQSHDKQMYEMGLKERLADDSDSYDALLPPAQPERKPGRWIPQNHNKVNGMTSTAVYYYPKCSVCGCCANYTNFCPGCGADMRGEQDE